MRIGPRILCAACSFVALLLPAIEVRAQGGNDALRDGFADPPAASKPRTWWHWTRGAVYKRGITQDLEWMRRVGIAGFQLADVNFGGGQSVHPTVDFGSDAWYDAVRHAAAEADRLDLEMAIFSSPGWSMTGGPWVTPEQAMKKLVWSETTVAGPQTFRGPLPQPPASAGSFQDMGDGRNQELEFYRDARTLAFRTPDAEAPPVAARPRVTSSEGEIDEVALNDGKFSKAVTIAAPSNGDAAWIEYGYDEPTTIRAVTIAGDGGIPVGRIAASDDGKQFRTLVTLPGSQLYRQARVRTFALPATTARFFRLEMTGAPLRPAPTMSEDPPQAAERYSLSEFWPERGGRVHRWEEKAGFGHLFEYETVLTTAASDDVVIESNAVVDLTEKVSPDGTLEWEVPPGRWTILRLGYSLTGAKNRPATPAGSGLEVDKLSAKHTTEYYDAYTKPIAKSLGDLYGRSLRYFLIDSWEAGTQNWTDDMIGEFTRRRGYDPTPYLPVLVGRVVDSAQVSDRFLWDFRRTLADIIADNHYEVMTELAHRDGFGVYSEASGVSLEIPEDTLLNKSKVDIPMGEFWVRDLHPRLMYLQDVRGAASAAHVYGKPIVAAEAFTGGGYESPFSLAKVSGYWLGQGINRLVYHTSAHQPLDTKPGNTMVGTHLHRNITWAELAAPFNEYVARTCYLLQQGRPVVDLVYFLPEGAPSTPPIWGAGPPAPPDGHRHDFINADALLNRLSVADDGRLVLPDGMNYQVLVLPESRAMRPELIEKLRELVISGAKIVGPRPLESPSLMGQPQADARVAELAEELWGDLNGTTRTVRYVGLGMVVWGRPLKEVLVRKRIDKDFEFAGPLDADVAWLHRRTEDADIYYVSNLTHRPVKLETRVRVAGRQAEIWRPDSGATAPASYSIEGGRTTVPLELERNETVFIVLRGDATSPSREIPQPTFAKLGEVSSEWTLEFPAGLGAPEQISLPRLALWSEHEAPGVRYFSGTGTYSTSFDAPNEWFTQGRRLEIDLGDVRDIAEVVVNDRQLGMVWKPPYRVDATSALRPGENRLEVRVTNQWTNRIAGDRAATPKDRVLAELPPAFGRGPRELEPSGLMGPVQILATE
jgi:hypothetical protein